MLHTHDPEVMSEGMIEGMMEQSELTSSVAVPRFIEFIEHDPGRKIIGSFNPIARNFFSDEHIAPVVAPAVTVIQASRAAAG